MPPADIAARVTRLTPADAGEVMTLQRAAWVSEAVENDTLDIPPLHETLADVIRDLGDPRYTAWGVRDAGRLVAMVRTSTLADGRTAFVGRLGVAPDRQGEGLGSAVLRWGEEHVADEVTGYRLVTGARSRRNLAFYAGHGYAVVADPDGPPGTVTLTRPR